MIDLAEEIYGVDIKKNFFRAVEYIWFHRENFHFKMNALYRALGTSKQSFHQKLNRLYMLRSEQEQLFIMIHQLREEHPTMGDERHVL